MFRPAITRGLIAAIALTGIAASWAPVSAFSLVMLSILNWFVPSFAITAFGSCLIAATLIEVSSSSLEPTEGSVLALVGF